MKCTECSKPALRIGTKGRGYCGDHAENAFSQMKKDAKRKDAINALMTKEIRLEAHRNHVLRVL